MNNPFEIIDARLKNLECLILSLKHDLPAKVELNEDQLLTIKQASELAHLSVPTFYGLVHRSEVPCMKKGKRLYFSKQELTDWIKTGRKKTIAESSIEASIYLKNKRND